MFQYIRAPIPWVRLPFKNSTVYQTRTNAYEKVTKSLPAKGIRRENIAILFICKKRRTRFLSRDRYNLLEFRKKNTHPTYPTQPNCHEMSYSYQPFGPVIVRLGWVGWKSIFIKEEGGDKK